MHLSRRDRFAAGMAAAASSLVLAYLFYRMGTGPYFSLDSDVAAFILNSRVPAFNNLMVGLTYLGNFYVEVAIAGMISALLARKGQIPKAAIILVSVLGGEVLIAAVKLYLKRPRPPESYWLVHEFSYGFPSGHAFASVSLYGLLLYLLVGKSGRKTRFIAAAGWVMFAALLGFSRIYLGVHWTTDVLGGYALGVAWVVFLVSTANFYARQ